MYFKKSEKDKSIHISSWPKYDKEDKEAEKIGDIMIKVIAAVRQFKNQKQKSLKEPVKLLVVSCKVKLDSVLDDLKAVTKAEKIEFEDSEELKIKIEL